MKPETIYKKALTLWGKEAQIIIFFEELGELMQAISKAHRYNQFTRDPSITEELADVELMIEQMKVLFQISELELGIIKKRKLARLEEKFS